MKTNTIAAIFLTLVMASSCALVGQGNFDQGLSLFNQGRFAAAIPYLEDATRENPNAAQAYLYLGRAYLSQSNWRAAIQPLRTAFRLAPSEAQGEIVNLIIDAGFASALNEFRLGDLLNSPSRSKDIL
ncbi:MAG: tetratricopeptide repeat protein [Deltaproteobacteria bacterium]|nr:tetratricopeptide repeat protein [Deltaproteobacteria bacterium]